MRLRSMQVADDLSRKSKDFIARYMEEYDDDRTRNVRAETLASVRKTIVARLLPGVGKPPSAERLAAVDLLLRLLSDIEEGRVDLQRADE